MPNYFNTLNLRQQLAQLGVCRFMGHDEFAGEANYLKGKKVVIVGCGAQGLNQGLNMRDSELDIAYALRAEAIAEKRASWRKATENGFKVGTYEKLIPQADLVVNLTPDKQHSAVVQAVQPLMKQGASLGYSHGFNILEVGEQIREDITVVMVAPKCPGTEVREEYKRGFGVPTLIAVHPENDPKGEGMAIAKAWAAATARHRAGVLQSSFAAEVKFDLMGEQTILCGMLQAGSLLSFDKLVAEGTDPAYAEKLIQFGWETITEALKQGGITLMNHLSNPAKLRAYALSEQLKTIMAPLFQKHMDDIISGAFSSGMMEDWANDDIKLLTWREETGKSAFENAPPFDGKIAEQEYFDHGVLIIAMVKAGVELAFETMVSAGIIEESAYYESLHELPLIANTIARKRLYEMNVVISDTAEYGNYLFANAAVPLLKQAFMASLQAGDIGKPVAASSVDNAQLRDVNDAIRNHPIEAVGQKPRGYMKYMRYMKRIAVAG